MSKILDFIHKELGEYKDVTIQAYGYNIDGLVETNIGLLRSSSVVAEKHTGESVVIGEYIKEGYLTVQDVVDIGDSEQKIETLINLLGKNKAFSNFNVQNKDFDDEGYARVEFGYVLSDNFAIQVTPTFESEGQFRVIVEQIRFNDSKGINSQDFETIDDTEVSVDLDDSVADLASNIIDEVSDTHRFMLESQVGLSRSVATKEAEKVWSTKEQEVNLLEQQSPTELLEQLNQTMNQWYKEGKLGTPEYDQLVSKINEIESSLKQMHSPSM